MTSTVTVLPGATPAASTPAATAPPISPPVREAPRTTATSGAAAPVALDSIRDALADGDGSAARAAVPALRALLPRLANATDSTWAHIRLLEAYALMDDVRAACRSLDAARGKARTASQREAVSRWSGQLSCD